MRGAKAGSIGYIFDINLSEARKIFPNESGLERIATIQNSTLGSSVLFALYRYRGSLRPWDVVVEYARDTSKPDVMRHAKGELIYLVDKEVHIPGQHDIIFHFDGLAQGYDGEFSFDELRDHVINAFLQLQCLGKICYRGGIFQD